MFLVLLFIFGLLIGSFLNVLILRLPEGESIGGRSHCPHCRHELGPWELVPLFSYLFLRGKCLSCKAKISPRYFIIELITALLFVTAGFRFGPLAPAGMLPLVKVLIASSLLLVVFMVDLEHFVILDKVIIAGVILVTVANICIDVFYPGAGVLRGATALGVLAGVAGALPFFGLWYVSRGTWMGFGDVKLVLLLGAIVGWPLIWLNLFLAFFIGALYSIVPLAIGSKTLNSRVPFGTFLSLACLITLYFGAGVWHWYLRLIGWA